MSNKRTTSAPTPVLRHCWLSAGSDRACMIAAVASHSGLQSNTPDARRRLFCTRNAVIMRHHGGARTSHTGQGAMTTTQAPLKSP